MFNHGKYLKLNDANQDNYLKEFWRSVTSLASLRDPQFQTRVCMHCGPRMTLSVCSCDCWWSQVHFLREYWYSRWHRCGQGTDIQNSRCTYFVMDWRQVALWSPWPPQQYFHEHAQCKVQKGLHLNEDIFTGMNAFRHSGCIKHMEYYQCSKGCDLTSAQFWTYRYDIVHSNVNNERCQAQRERCNPEVDEVWGPQRDSDIQQHYQRTHAH